MSAIVKVLEHPLFALFVGFVLAAAAFSGKFSVTATKVMLAFALLVAAVGIARAEAPPWLRVVAYVGVVVIVTGVAWWLHPVRGPFAALSDPQSTDTFTVYYGAEMPFPIERLRDGIDLSHVVALPDDPIDIRIKRRWLGGLDYEIRYLDMTLEPGRSVPTGWDMNSDDNAIELVDGDGLPRLQIVQSSDYDVHVNVSLQRKTGGVWIVKGQQILIDYPPDRLRREDFPETIFKYPSYIHKGVRR